MANAKGSHIAPDNRERKNRRDSVPSRERYEEPESARDPASGSVAEEELREKTSSGRKPERRHVFGKILLVLFTLLVAAGIVGLGTALIVVHGPSEQAKTLFVRTFMDTGTMKWVPG